MACSPLKARLRMIRRPMDTTNATREPLGSRGGRGRILPLALGGLVLLGAGIWIGSRFMPTLGSADGPMPRVVVPRGPLPAAEMSAVEVFKRVAFSVVHIDTTVTGNGRGGFLDMNRLFQNERIVGTGSGIVWDELGHIVTNQHVVDNAESCLVTLADGSEWRAALIGQAPAYDLAVLRIDAPAGRLGPIPVGRSSDLNVGQRVYAIGNPFGLDQSLSSGIVSAIDRMILGPEGSVIDGLIQTDAAINPGNSGGPLLDSAGRLIGVSTGVVSPTGVFSGIGFAVPVDIVNKIVPKLLTSGYVPRPGLGVRLVGEQERMALGLEGALIAMVLVGSGADRAGLIPWSRDSEGRMTAGDLIVAVAGQRIMSNAHLSEVIADFEVGQSVELAILREGTRLMVEVELGGISQSQPGK